MIALAKDDRGLQPTPQALSSVGEAGALQHEAFAARLRIAELRAALQGVSGPSGAQIDGRGDLLRAVSVLQMLVAMH